MALFPQNSFFRLASCIPCEHKYENSRPSILNLLSSCFILVRDSSFKFNIAYTFLRREIRFLLNTRIKNSYSILYGELLCYFVIMENTSGKLESSLYSATPFPPLQLTDSPQVFRQHLALMFHSPQVLLSSPISFLLYPNFQDVSMIMSSLFF